MRAIALGLLLLWPGLGCGGSSSETPPPLEPDATSSRYVGPRFPKPEDVTAPAPASAPEPDEDDLPVNAHKPAAATWGSGKPTPSAPVPAPAPTLSSPTTAPVPGAAPR
jgi:hypothetical protein